MFMGALSIVEEEEATMICLAKGDVIIKHTPHQLRTQ